MNNYSFEIFIIILFALLSAFFSGSETALFSLKRADLDRYNKSGNSIQRLIAKTMKKPQDILITILIGNLFANLIITALTTSILLNRDYEYGQFISIGIVTPLLIIFCEVSPKIISISFYESVSMRFFPLLNLFHKILFPLRVVLLYITDFTIKVLNLKGDRKRITKEELDIAVHEGEREGIIEKEEGDFIKNVLRFSRKTGASVMFPRNRAIFIPQNATITGAMKIFLDTEIIRAPVYKDDIDHIVGMIDSKELIPYFLGLKKAKSIRKFIRTIEFYPSSLELNLLLNEFLSKRIQLAVMVDEYGGTDGIVTLNSILAELMGKKFSKWDTDSKPDIRTTAGDVSVISGEMQIDDFNFHFQEKLISSEADTIGGYITEKLSHFPRRGEEVVAGRYTLRVKYVRRNKVETVEVIQRGTGE